MPNRHRRRADHILVRGALAGVKVAVAVLSVLIVLTSGYAWASFRSLSQGLTTIKFGTPGAASVLVADHTEQNILLVGDDSREGASPEALAALGTEANAGDNTDTIMVLHIPADGKKATLLSFPRDSLVDIPGFGRAKINSAYSDGAGPAGDVGAGARKLKETISALTHLQIAHFVKVSMFGFYDISKAIKGIDVTMCAAQNASTENDDGHHPGGYSGIDLVKGANHIDGKQALAFVRQRHGLVGSDYARIVRQEYFLSAAFKKVASAGSLSNPATLQHLVRAVAKSLVVDDQLQGQALIRLALQLRDLSAGNLLSATIPMLGQVRAGQQYLGEGVDRAALPGFIATLLAEPAPRGAPLPSSAKSGVPKTGAPTSGSASLRSSAKTGSPTSIPSRPATGSAPTGSVSPDAAASTPVAAASTRVPAASTRVPAAGTRVPAAGTPVAAKPTAAFSAPAGPTSNPVVHNAAQDGCIN